MSLMTGIGKVVVTGNAPNEISLEWEIPNFSSLNEERWSRWFGFSHNIWYFGLKSYKEARNGDTLELFLRQTVRDEITFIYTFGLKNVNGTAEYVQKKTSTLSVASTLYFARFSPASELTSRKSELLPSDTLTVLCTLHMIHDACDVGELLVIREAPDEIEVQWKISELSKYEKMSPMSPNFCLPGCRWYLTVKMSSGVFWVNNEEDSAGGCYETQQETSLQSFGYTMKNKDGTSKTVDKEKFMFNRFCDGSREIVPREGPIELQGDMLTVQCHLKLVHSLHLESEYLIQDLRELLINGNSNEEIQADVCPNLHLENEYLIQDLRELLISGKGSNVTLKVKDREFKAHKLILQLRLPDFFAEFQNEMLTGLVVVKDCDPDTYSDFLHFVYTGYVKEFSTQKAVNLYKTADKHRHPGLKEVCLEYMRDNITEHCFCDIMSIAFTNHETELYEVATHFFLMNGSEIIRTKKWISFLGRYTEEGNSLMVQLFDKQKLQTV